MTPDMELISLADEYKSLSKQYLDEKTKLGEARVSFKLILASKEAGYRQMKKNVGIEAMELMLLAEGGEGVVSYYRQRERSKELSDGLLQLAEAVKEQINVRKWILKNDH